MHPFETLIGQLEFVSNNLVYNLDFIPEDKLNWKPAPEANSVLEIINHVAMPLSGMAHALDGQWRVAFESAQDGEEAKALILKLSQEYAEKLRGLTVEDMSRTVKTPMSELPLPMAAGIPVVDLIHHHGQIAYIQTMLGDSETHFDPSLLG